MKNTALLLGLLIILGGVGWYLFHSVVVVEAPDGSTGSHPETPAAGNSWDGVESPADPSIGEPGRLVQTFEDCVAAGNAVMESYPRQCLHDGVTYVEDVSLVPGGDEDQPVACTMDAKLCPDGSAVGRTGANCEFASCPGEDGDAPLDMIVCSPESKLAQMCTMEYAPVCGLVEVQCITAPCDPVPETFGNACSACAQQNVVGYTEGACEGAP